MILLFFAVLCFSHVENIYGSVDVQLPVNGPDIGPYADLVARIERLEQRDEQQTERIARLESKMAAMGDIIKQQQDEIEALRQPEADRPVLPPLQKDQQERSTEWARVSRIVSGSGVGNTAKLRQSRREGLRRLTRSFSDITRVAFFASVVRKNVSNLGVDQNIVFENVTTNIGNAFNPHHGIFTAPASGTYLFAVSIMAHSSPGEWTHIVVNGKLVSRVFAGSSYAQGSRTVILTLQQGDDVGVQNERASSSIHGEGYTSFTGLLLWADMSESAIVG